MKLCWINISLLKKEFLPSVARPPETQGKTPNQNKPSRGISCDDEECTNKNCCCRASTCTQIRKHIGITS
jgi:hypothetical protein